MVVKASNEIWEEFLATLLQQLTTFEVNESSLEEVQVALWRFSESVDNDVIDACFDIITEIGGSPGNFVQLKAIVSTKPTHRELSEHLEI